MPAIRINPRKKPRQARSTSTYEAIVESATRILEATRLDIFTTNLIAERAGVSIGTLYQYFPSKEAVLTELIRRKRAQLLQGLRTAASRYRHDDLASALEGLIQAALQQQLRRPRLVRALHAAAATLPIDSETERLKQDIVAIITDVLKAHGVKEPIMCARDIAALTRGIVDAPGSFGEGDHATLERRLKRAVFGYLGIEASQRRD